MLWPEINNHLEGKISYPADKTALQTAVTAEGLGILQHAMEDKNVHVIIDVQQLEVQFLPKPAIMVGCSSETDWQQSWMCSNAAEC